MKSKEELIEKFKNFLYTKDIKCYDEYSFIKKSFSSDKIFLNFMKEIKCEEMNAKPVFYKIYEVNNISLCTRHVDLYIDDEFDIVKEEKIKRFLFIPYKIKTIKKVIKQEYSKKINELKRMKFDLYRFSDNSGYKAKKKLYVITFEDLIFEIDEVMFKELEQFVLNALVEKSALKVNNL